MFRSKDDFADGEEVPDHFKDPAEEVMEETMKITRQLNKKHNKDFAKAVAWQIYWQSASMEPDSPEEEPISHEDMQVALLFRIELLMLEMLSEMKKGKAK